MKYLKALIALLTLLAFFITLGTFSMIPGNWHPYKLKKRETGQPTHANLEVGEGERRDGMFIGIALSGGGSRAANFESAALLELKKLGVLGRADFLSAVSGGTFPATYFALEGFKYSTLLRGGSISFEEDELRDRLGRNFQLRYTVRWFFPWNIFRYWLTNFNRTDIMFDVLDANLFHGATYADLNPARPKLLINATGMDEVQNDLFSREKQNDLGRKNFVFSDETFGEVGADLSQVPLTVAATASAAVPGFFHSVTLKAPIEGEPTFLHLIDGAVTDEQGILTLVEVLRKSVRDKTYAFPLGCILIAIDAAPNFHNRFRHLDETRLSYKDYLFDRNVSDAVSYMLLPQRRETLELVGMASQQIDVAAFSDFRILPDSAESPTCHFWHIALRHIPITAQNLQGQASTASDQPIFGERLAHIPTELDITKEQQEDLFEAACHLVGLGWKRGASKWFEETRK